MDAYRGPEQVEEQVETSGTQVRRWARKHVVDLVSGGIVLAALTASVRLWVDTAPHRAAAEQREAAQVAVKKSVCDSMGLKNATAWAQFMGVKTPRISCAGRISASLFGEDPSGCKDILLCSVGAGDGLAVYGIRCNLGVGDGVDREGSADNCWLVSK